MYIVDKAKALKLQYASRLASYAAIWFAYLAFMASHAPRGIDWFPWHLQRIYNAVQYLKINGYLSAYGFSIWSQCRDCGLAMAEWTDKIYVSSTAIKLAPYIFINHFWGLDALRQYGPVIDRMVIFIGAVVAAELVIRCVRSYSSMAPYVVGVGSFALFVTAPWTYKMLLNSWFEIYFLMFFLMGLLLLANERHRMACAMLFLSGVFHYVCAAIVAALYVLFFLLSPKGSGDKGYQLYEPPYGRQGLGKSAIVFSLMFPALVEFFLRWYAQLTLRNTAGSSLLTRVGISGDDIHNGGLLGALQFLGGNRITVCVANYDSGTISGNLTDGITQYNCMLSILGMGSLSLAAVVGIVILLKRSIPAKWIIFPAVYTLVIFTTLMQQSLSVHLLGYSYIFSFLFAAGIVGLMVYFSALVRSSTLSIALAIPCVVGITFLSIRVSMLTGANG